jgi:hypothetical protein
MNLGTFCPLEKNWHILTPLVLIIFVIGKLRVGRASFEISQVCERAIGAGKDLQRHLGPGRGATINNSLPLQLLRG